MERGTQSDWFALPNHKHNLGERRSGSGTGLPQSERLHRRSHVRWLWCFHFWCSHRDKEVCNLLYLLQSILNSSSAISMSVKLSGNRNNPALNLENKKDAHHVTLYTAEAVKDNTEIALTRGGLVLFALLSGGDYHKVWLALNARCRI